MNFLKYTKTLGRSKLVLRLAVCGLMLFVLIFYFKQTIPLVDPTLFTIDFLYKVYNIQDVGLLLLDYLPFEILRDYDLMNELQ